MKLLHSYTNGNTCVSLYEDGTKERIYDGVPSPLFPESIDVKITNWCDANCSYCHESSTVDGVHGDLNKLLETLKDLPPGVELALGGGAPQNHPDLFPFLRSLKERSIIANITINQKHLKRDKDLILSLIKEDLVKGIGISYSSPAYLEDIKPIIEASNNVVFHMIMGINKLSDINDLNKICSLYNKECKILLLGYKYFGFGINYYIKNKKIEDNKYQWYTQVARFFKQDNIILSFDNLAIEQLKLKRFFTEEAWNNFYMGNDFIFTCYIDGVKQQFAPTSTSHDRKFFTEYSLIEYFQKYRGTYQISENLKC